MLKRKRRIIVFVGDREAGRATIAQLVQTSAATPVLLGAPACGWPNWRTSAATATVAGVEPTVEGFRTPGPPMLRCEELPRSPELLYAAALRLGLGSRTVPTRQGRRTDHPPIQRNPMPTRSAHSPLRLPLCGRPHFHQRLCNPLRAQRPPVAGHRGC